MPWTGLRKGLYRYVCERLRSVRLHVTGFDCLEVTLCG